MTRTADDLYPENYENWPRSIQRRYWVELHALYFPEQYPGRQSTHQAALTVAADPADDIPEAEIIE